jgi:hypothetical protein
MDSHTVLHLAHLLVLGPLLIAIGLGYSFGLPRIAIAALGVFITLYHAYKTYAKVTNGQNPWVNLIHVLVVGPALIANGLTETRWSQEIVLMLGFAAVAYHGFYLMPFAA